MEYTAVMRVFFKLRLGLLNIQDILDEIEDYEPAESVLTEDHFSTIQTIPRAIDLGNLDSTKKIEYVPDRFLLRFATKSNLMLEAFNIISNAFEKQYPFNDTVRFFEFGFVHQSVKGENISELISNFVKIPKLDELSEKMGTNFVPYSFSLSYPHTPLTDDWTHIELTPEAMNPTGNLLVRVTKRAQAVKDMKVFLEKLNTINFPEFLLEWIQSGVSS